mgnify:CR=1 FL=1
MNYFFTFNFLQYKQINIEIYQKLTESGVKFNAPPQLSPDGYAKVTFCLDPDNTPVELVQVLN